MDTVTVYRVEHRITEDGPYVFQNGDTNWDAVSGLHRAHNGSTIHPGPYGDTVIGMQLTHDHSFGFGSRAQLDAWFKGFKKKLHAADFVIRVFEAPAISTTISGFQAIFVKDESRLIETLPAKRGAKLPA